MVKLEEIFDIQYGNGFALSSLIEDADGISFVSRKSCNNGVAGKVAYIEGCEPFESGLITVAVSGSVLESFVQPKPFFTSYHVMVLSHKFSLTMQEKLYYCMCIRANKYKYSYGRQANKTLKDIKVPSKEEIPSWVNSTNVPNLSNIQRSAIDQPVPDLYSREWRAFRYDELFDIQRGLGPRKMGLTEIGMTPFVTSKNNNNGISSYCNSKPTHKGNVITVNRIGSVGESFYQPTPFCTTENVHVFNPKFNLNPYLALFICALIRKEIFRYSYGRTWSLERMQSSVIKLPVTAFESPDWVFIEHYIKTLRFSSNL